jgi:Tol biopolymer transport system component
MGTTGAGFAALTSNPLRNDWAPAWGVGQGEIIFARGPDGASQLWVMKPDGTGQQQLTNPPAGQGDSQPAMSPDGTKIVFQRFYQLWLINSNGTNPRPLLDYSAQPQPAYVEDEHPTWSPDGTEVAFARSHGGLQLICTTTVGARAQPWNNVQALTGVGFPLWPSWFPGVTIAYRNEADLNVVNIHSFDPHTARDISLSHPGVDQEDMWPSWSPSGDQIAFQRIGYSQPPNPNAYVSHIWIMRADGTGEEDVSALRMAQNPTPPANDWTPNWT